MLANWDQIKKGEDGREPGIFGDVPENLPGPLYALKTQRRAASTGFDFDHVPYEHVRDELSELEIGHETSSLGTGGMRSKVVAAEMATAAGINTVIGVKERPVLESIFFRFFAFGRHVRAQDNMRLHFKIVMGHVDHFCDQ